MQKVERLVVFYLEDMRVTSYEELWRIGKEQLPHADIVVAWIATNMFDQHIDILALETVQFAIHQSQVASVAVAADSSQGTILSQFLSHLQRADIASMPYLVAGLKVMEVLWVPVAVGVADDADSLHDLRF